MALSDFFRSATGATYEDIRRESGEADPYETMYRTGKAGLERMQSEQAQRFAQAAAPQEAAVAALGQRAATLEGGAALQGVQQARERAQAQAMVAARTPYGGKGASPEAAILGGAIGVAPAAQFGALEQEAAARQSAYLRGIGSLGQMTLAEAEERRRTEEALLKDMQARYAAAMQQAQFEQQREAQDRQRAMGVGATVIGTALGAVAGGPKGAMAGFKAGQSFGG